MSKFYFLLEYLLCPKIICKLKPEDEICYNFSNYLREKTLMGNCSYVWFHVANEGYTSTSNKIKFWGIIKKAIGKFPGVADYIFLGKDKCFALEIKTKKTRQSPNQKIFEKWCILNNVSYTCVFTYEEAINFLQTKGIVV